MKKTYLALLISGLALLAPQLWADDDSQDDNAPGGPIQGTETLEAKIVMSPTANAPAGASGLAELEAEDENGVQTAKLSVETQGLSPGDYTLSIVKISDGSSVTLGQISIGSAGGDPNQQSGDGSGQGENSKGGQDKRSRESGGLEGRTEVQLPPDLDAMDIAQIVLSDLSGNALLVGDLLNPAKKTVLKFKGAIQITPGEGAPSAKGKALLRSLIRKGKRTNGFALSASGVPAGSTFEVHLNGKSVGTVKSSNKGKVSLRKLPANLSSLHSVRLMDAQGKAAATAHF